MDRQKNDLVFDMIIYHANCPDGFTAAWVFWTGYRNNCQYIPCKYGQPPPDVTNKVVAIVDFSYPRDILLNMASKAKYLLVLDHHSSARENLLDLSLNNGEIIFDLKQCGAELAWNYLCWNSKKPWFIDYVADRDLWRNVLPYTKEISFALFFDGYFTDFTKLTALVNIPSSNFVKRGSDLLSYKNQDCRRYAESSMPTIFSVGGAKYRVNLVNCPRMYRSDVGNIICSAQDCDFAGVYWFDFCSNEWWVSFRSKKDSKHNLAAITAQLPNGGGHPNAAGFTIYTNRGESLETYFTACSPIPRINHYQCQDNNNEYRIKQYQVLANSAKHTLFTIAGKTFRVKLAGCPWVYRSAVAKLIAESKDCDFGAIYWHDFGSKKWFVYLDVMDDRKKQLDAIITKLGSDWQQQQFANLNSYFKILDVDNGKQ